MRSTSPELQDARPGSAWCRPPRATTRPLCATSTTPPRSAGSPLPTLRCSRCRTSTTSKPYCSSWMWCGCEGAAWAVTVGDVGSCTVPMPPKRAAWQAGHDLTGVSAGSICWHVGGTTDSFGPDLRPVTNGLGLVPFSNGIRALGLRTAPTTLVSKPGRRPSRLPPEYAHRRRRRSCVRWQRFRRSSQRR